MVRRKLPLFQTLSRPTKGVENPTASITLVLLVVALCCLFCFASSFHLLLFLIFFDFFGVLIFSSSSFLFCFFIFIGFPLMFFFFLVVAVAVTDVGGIYIWRWCQLFVVVLTGSAKVNGREGQNGQAAWSHSFYHLPMATVLSHLWWLGCAGCGSFAALRYFLGSAFFQFQTAYSSLVFWTDQIVAHLRVESDKCIFVQLDGTGNRLTENSWILNCHRITDFI